MSRRDMIIIAVLVNLGVLAVIFITAIGFDDDHVMPSASSTEALAEASTVPEPIDSFTPPPHDPREKSHQGDEVDRMLNLYIGQEGRKEGSKEMFIVHTPIENSLDSPQSSTLVPTQPEHSTPVDEEATQQYVEIVVKKGDFLDKIARANGTTADHLIQINQLPNDRIDVGQVLKVPVSNAKKSTKNTAGTTATTAKKTEKKADTAKSTTNASSDVQYYTVKSGDNPWKIARQFHVKFEDLLKLNNLNEEKARNLKVGDKIRVK